MCSDCDGGVTCGDEGDDGQARGAATMAREDDVEFRQVHLREICERVDNIEARGRYSGLVTPAEVLYASDVHWLLLELKGKRDMEMVQKGTPTIGRIVHYTLSAQDAEHINRRRVQLLDSAAQAKNGTQVHVGNSAREGDMFPMMICRVWGPEMVNGQVFLDGNDSLWVTSRHEGNEPGAWHWPERV